MCMSRPEYFNQTRRPDPKKLGSGRNRPDQTTLSDLVAEDPRILDPTRPKLETRWVPELIV